MLHTMLHRLLENPVLFNLMRTYISGDFTLIRHELVAPPVKRILDIACGTAFYAKALYGGKNLFYCGIDANPGYIAYAARNFRDGHFAIGDAFKLPVAAGSFDMALSLGFLHHLTDEQVPRALREIHRALTPGGTLVLAEPVLFFRFLRYLLIPTRVLITLDRGRYVRDPQGYVGCFPEGFTLMRDYPFRNGPHDWWAFILRRDAGGKGSDANG